jgi:hypothetical protein
MNNFMRQSNRMNKSDLFCIGNAPEGNIKIKLFRTRQKMADIILRKTENKKVIYNEQTN